MIFKIEVAPNGDVTTEVVDRQEHLCDQVYRITNKLGKQLSDEELPDCSGGNTTLEYNG